jgi:hypothetical protein
MFEKILPAQAGGKLSVQQVFFCAKITAAFLRISCAFRYALVSCRKGGNSASHARPGNGRGLVPAASRAL